MKVTVESLHKRYSSMNTEALADLYHGELTDLAVNVLKEVITSRGLDWTEFTTHSNTEPESQSHADWSLWRFASGQAATEETGDKSQHEANGAGTPLVALLYILFGVIALVIFADSDDWWNMFWPFAIAIGGALVVVAGLEVKRQVCPACRRWFAFKQTGDIRSISHEQLTKKEEKRACKYCKHKGWVRALKSSSGVYVGDGDDDGGGEGSCGGGGE